MANSRHPSRSNTVGIYLIGGANNAQPVYCDYQLNSIFSDHALKHMTPLQLELSLSFIGCLDFNALLLW